MMTSSPNPYKGYRFPAEIISQCIWLYYTFPLSYPDVASRHRDMKAAKRFFRKLLKKQGFVPRVIVTDKLKSYEAAKKQVVKNVEHRQHKGLNNRAENSLYSNSNATNATIQIPWSSPTMSLCIWTNPRPLPPETTSTNCSTLSPTTQPKISRLARSCLSDICCLVWLILTSQESACFFFEFIPLS